MHSQSIIERFRWNEEPLGLERDGLLAIYPLVVDTNILLSDVIASLRRRTPSRLLTLAHLGKLRIFAAAHVSDEVRMHLPRMAWEHQLPPLDALQWWMVNYLPIIRFVDVPHLDLGDPRPGHIQDADDVPTAELVAILAPIISLSNDAHLVEPGMARRDWRFLVEQGQTVATKDIIFMGTVVTASMGGDLGLRAVRATIRPVRAVRSTVAIGAGVILLATLALWLRYRILACDETPDKHTSSPRSTRLRTAFESAKATALVAILGLSSILDDATAAANTLESGKVRDAARPETERAIAIRLLSHLLAAAPRSMTATDLVKVLTSSSHVRRTDISATLKLLNGEPAFVPIGASRWQLGAQKAVDPEAINRMRRAIPTPMFAPWQ